MTSNGEVGLEVGRTVFINGCFARKFLCGDLYDDCTDIWVFKIISYTIHVHVICE